MRKLFLYIFAINFILISCRTSKIVPKTNEINNSLKMKEIKNFHSATKPQFSSLSGSINISFDNGKQQQSVPMTIRMKMGETIWLSAPLGLAKALLTPEKVQFYNKMDNSYFEGDYSIAEHFLGVKLDYYMLENMLLGQLIFDEKTNYQMNIESEGYVFSTKEIKLIENKSVINPNFRIGSLEMKHLTKNLDFIAKYTYQSIDNQLFPNEIYININDEFNYRTKIDIQFNNIELNTRVNFPYKVPSGYKLLSIKE